MTNNRAARNFLPAQQTRRAGRQEAVRLYAALASGQRPPAVYAPDLSMAGTVYLDVPFTYSRFYGMNASYRPGAWFTVGTPGMVAGAALGNLIGTGIGMARAAAVSRRRWRGHRPARVVVTAPSTWCRIGSGWLRFDHTAVLDYRLDGEQSCVLGFVDAVPLRLSGPSAWCHAVLYAYLRYGPGWQTAPFLHPLRPATR